jgi:polysaccharide biosynthesis transport protein
MTQVYGQEAPSFSIADVLGGMGRRKLLMLSSLLFGLLVGGVVVTIFEPSYQSEARVLIENLETPYDRANVTQQDSRETPIDQRTITSQVAVLSSEDLALRVIMALNLQSKDEFDSLKKGIGPVKKFLISAGFKDDPRLMTVEQRALDHLTQQITIYPIPESNVIGIKYQAGDGQTAADVANTLAQTYVSSTRESKSTDNVRARQWLSTQIEELRGKVSVSDAAVEKFRAESGLLKGAVTTLGVQEISELNTQITLAEAARTETAAKAAEIKELLEKEGSVEASSEVLASSAIQSLRLQQVDAQRRLSELSVTYLPNHPKMRAALKQLSELDRLVRREALKIVDGLQGQAKIAAAREKSLRNSLETMKSREGNSLQDDVKLKVLEREAKANRDQLETMLARFADSNTRQNLDLQPGFARIIQSAAPAATPFFPRKGPTVLLATLAGLGIGLGLAFLLEIMAQASRLNQNAGNPVQAPTRAQQTSRSADDTPIIIPKLDIPTSEPKTSVSVAAVKPPEKEIEKPVEKPAPAKLPVLASLPQVRSMSEAKSLLASLSENGSMSDTMRRLSNQVQAMHESGMLKACAMTSVGGALEGATTAIALSRSLALADIKTILIDLDGARGVIEDLMELPTAPGITDLLEGSADFSKAIQRDSQTELQVLRHGAATGAIAAQVPQRMEAITRTLTSIYEVVILHIGEASPSMLFSARGCTTVLVNAPLSRKADALAAGATLKSKGFDQVFLIQVEDALKAAA